MGKDAYLRFVLDYGTRPLWVADAGTNLMLNRAFPAVWEPGKGLLVAFSQIRDEYKSLFEDNLHEFRYKGLRDRAPFVLPEGGAYEGCGAGEERRRVLHRHQPALKR